MKNLEQFFDIIVVGAGHAGCEASLACARLGLNTVMFTVSVDSIALMPCNPNVGGSSKGHLVRELDALGGEMGKNIDKTFIQSKMLNQSKGPAVHSLRAQADKQAYSTQMRKTLENTENLTIRQGEVTELLVEDGHITGVKTFSGATYHAKAVVLCTGTYLKARCIYGDVSNYTGPNGLQAANYLTDSLKKLGIEMFRFKTGTPARIAGNTIDYSKMEEQFGDERVVPFSFSTDPESVQIEQKSCWLTYTNEKTHEIIRANLDRSPLYSGMIEGTGPRYCPSIEDKVVRFADKKRHQVFIEPEGLYTNEMYIGGMSSSLPEDVQYEMYHSVPGLENAKIVKNAYAIEYDCINPRQLYPTLEFKKIKGLFSGGQFNGSSGYEEAAAQGLIAGINAAMEVKGREQLILDRSEAYIGVLIDDLVTKENHEPYRMMTSRAEYRLLLRQDNADLRLRKKGWEVGLIDDETYHKLQEKERRIQEEIERVEHATVGGSAEVQSLLESLNSTLLKSGTTIAELIRRPELNYKVLAPIDKERPELPEDVCEQVEINIKYDGYIRRQMKQVEQFKKLEQKKLPEDIDYEDVGSLRIEARQKLEAYRPVSIGQASRISGVSPADISVLLVYLESRSGHKH
ncbi:MULTISPECIES: tRNA uridine-5-carboxymethylaminomethyl(34) synthesis enzyme MnmG [Clostridia]|jgi:tRNA uridine 5-carboxymethylaminomethyl modification enzyme|uniref:tRNA uridine-5-carboxymethylaminomethyl(34) synthesis enzyme MnmG n=1 Tax=Clostridia TaxID=186801 RepID=UPI000E546969|nr:MULTISPECIES: tRNA uridine-5-carboxymethylaminomethyl(34) synthesis enzyme MnmG [Clostridia]MCJ7862858.1 tRNA uridine-5-carboxymethylaminomethyl(34) synthesis enzyme MnmG [Blautia sp. NSJ-157]MCJ7865674.1 tRNA uridine-5-carboxymethylaminomethyl(34) synthesis enzyme MnmG [Blautia sp. NSJ-140]RHP68666.1 tRNA uridine-5-carboxymethylaminomethyl(34) synthesis enzyme MnmG [Ruminococcus sp. OF02-6]RHR04451.1 tRNA uridine-5-carboxymethylaminomethyl(34) synthesis enzyme MnmG [Ruminococcus sp. AF20-12